MEAFYIFHLKNKNIVTNSEIGCLLQLFTVCIDILFSCSKLQLEAAPKIIALHSSTNELITALST